MSEFFNQLYWQQPLYLLLATFPLLLMLWKAVRQQHSLRQYADAHLLPWVVVSDLQKKTHWQNLLTFFIWLLFSISVAGPRLLISAPDELLPPQGAAIIVLDHSRSMLANDVSPTRRQLADKIVTQWSQQQNNLQLGLIIFSGASHILLPATTDNHALYETAQLLNKLQLPTYGNALNEALAQAKNLLTDVSGSRNIILLTDGDIGDKEYSQLKNIIAELQHEKIFLQLLGVGSLSPTPLEDRPGRWLKYNNKAVMTRLKESELIALTNHNHVDYLRLNPDVHHQLSSVWQPETKRITVQDQHRAVWQELFSWPLLAALLLVIIKQLPVTRFFVPRTLLLIFLSISSVLITQPQTAYAATQENQFPGKSKILKRAYLAWQKNNFSTAAKLYAQLEGYAARMGEGASCFREQQIECAINAFSRAAWLATDDLQRGQAAFNLANSFFKQGDFKSAINLYADALRYQPLQSSYKNNLAFSREVLQNIERNLQLEARRKNAQRTATGQGEIFIDTENENISSLGLVPDQEPENDSIKKPDKIKLTEQQITLYMQRSKSFASLSAGPGKINQQDHDWSRFSNKNPTAAHKVAFWQRLLELEEDIPAHPESPKILPGVRPW